MLYTIDGYFLAKAKEELADEALRRLRKRLAHAHSECDELLRSSVPHREELERICRSAGVSSNLATLLVKDLVFGQDGPVEEPLVEERTIERERLSA